MIRVATKKHVQPYTALAAIYDQVMYHVNYDRWAAYIHAIITRFCPGASWVVDMTCGTGTFGAALLDYGYYFTGFDSSLPMLRQAQQKKRSAFQSLVCADVCHLPLGKKPDVVLSLYDSMNYLLEPHLWRTCLHDVYNTLREDGLFVFDVSTVLNSQRDFSRYVQKQRITHGSFRRISSFDAQNSIQINYFEIRQKQFPHLIFCETHRQRIRPLTEILQFVRESPFTFVEGFQDFTLKKYDEDCERVHFVLKKQSDHHVRTP